ncbi:MAG: tRNA (guanosine(46)-N7)-methyltransferase TrmB [Woeseiaceae bacterium]
MKNTGRSVRSFVRRAGRITRAQQRAMERLWPRYGVDFSAAPLDLFKLFGRKAARVLEIGFGDGESLVFQTAANPAIDYLGVDVHRPGIGHCLLAAEARGVSNLRLICHDAVEVLEQQIADESLCRVNLYFPDPWPKKRHHKRRLVQAGFLELVASRLVARGAFCIATDWSEYAEHIDDVIEGSRSFRLDERREHEGREPLDRPTTKFERRGLERGHKITEWRLVRR